MLKSRCGSETVVEGTLNQLVVSVVKCLVGRIDGVTAVVLNRRTAGIDAAPDEETEVDVAVVLSTMVRCRLPARVLGL